MVYYLETSALAKLYVMEAGTDRLLRLLGSSTANRFAVLSLSAVEARSAIRRRQRAGDIDSQTAEAILDRLQHHMEARFLRQRLDEIVLDGALEMIDRYALRAYDAVQLAGCLSLNIAVGAESPTFVSSDRELLEAARSELLATFDPCAP